MLGIHEIVTLAKITFSLDKTPFKKKFIFTGIITFALLIVLAIFLTVESVPGHEEFKDYLIDRLTRSQPLPIIAGKYKGKAINIVYILGGSQNSLINKYQTTAELYHRGLCKKILLLSNPGVTEFDSSLGRNLTNDEWAIKKLVALDVQKADIEPVAVKRGFFGTITEAKGISEIAIKRGYNRIILVTSRYHTARTWITFSKIFEHRNITAYIYAADEHVSLCSLLYEYFKLVLYQSLILPLYTDKQQDYSGGIFRISPRLVCEAVVVR